MTRSTAAIVVFLLFQASSVAASPIVFDFTLGPDDSIEDYGVNHVFDDETGTKSLTATAIGQLSNDDGAQTISLRNLNDGLGVHSGLFQITGVSNTSNQVPHKSIVFSFEDAVQMLNLQIEQRALSFDEFFHAIYGSNDDGILQCGGLACISEVSELLLTGSTTDTGSLTLALPDHGLYRHFVATVPVFSDGSGNYLVRGMNVAAQTDAPPVAVPSPGTGGLLAGGLALLGVAARLRRRTGRSESVPHD